MESFQIGEIVLYEFITGTWEEQIIVQIDENGYIGSRPLANEDQTTCIFVPPQSYRKIRKEWDI